MHEQLHSPTPNGFDMSRKGQFVEYIVPGTVVKMAILSVDDLFFPGGLARVRPAREAALPSVSPRVQTPLQLAR
jgi:hypothetical protein